MRVLRRVVGDLLRRAGFARVRSLDGKHRVTGRSETPETRALLSEIDALNPWFYPVVIDNIRVVPGIGSNQPPQRLNDRTMFREHLIVGEVLSRYDVRGKSILDLACNLGYWSSRYVAHGALRVLGVEGRQLFLDQARLFWSHSVPLPEDSYDFLKGNVLDASVWERIREAGPFDVCICSGILYHLPDYRELLERVARVTRDLIVVDTRLSDEPERPRLGPRGLFFNSIDEAPEEIVPNRGKLISCLESLGCSVEVLKPRYFCPADLPAWDDYCLGRRATMLANRRDRGTS